MLKKEGESKRKMDLVAEEESYNDQFGLSEQIGEARTLAAMFYAVSITKSIGNGKYFRLQ